MYQTNQKSQEHFIKFLFVFILGSSLLNFSAYSSSDLINTSLPNLKKGITTEEISFSERNILHSVWKISNSSYHGTAFAIGSNQMITSFHVMDAILKKSSLEDIILSQKGRVLTVKRILKIDRSYDLVLLETTDNVGDYLHITNTSPKAEDELFTAGYPRPLGVLTTIRKTLDVIYETNFSYIFPVDYSYFDGLSGSPIYTEKGHVIGVSYFGSTNILHIIKVKYLKKFIEEKVTCSPLDNIKLCFDRELDNTKQEAKQGNVISQWTLGRMYYYGKGIEKDFALAAYWLKKAANQGYPLAQEMLADMYYYGEGVEKNLDLVFYWLTKAAEQGFSPVQYQLYEKYKEIRKDLVSAAYWLKESTKRGYAPAQYQLAMMYQNGEEGLDKDLDLVFYWLAKAANQGYAPAQYMLGKMYYEAEELEFNFNLAAYWLKKAANQEYYLARQMLYEMYYYGEPGIE